MGAVFLSALVAYRKLPSTRAFCNPSMWKLILRSKIKKSQEREQIKSLNNRFASFIDKVSLSVQVPELLLFHGDWPPQGCLSLSLRFLWLDG